MRLIHICLTQITTRESETHGHNENKRCYGNAISQLFKYMSSNMHIFLISEKFWPQREQALFWKPYQLFKYMSSNINVQPALVESSHRLKSVGEANNVIKVVYFEMGRLKCDRVDRFY